MYREAATPKDYLQQIEGEQLELIEAIRSVIFQELPDQEEIIEYGMLGYPDLANLAAQKHYVALYVAPPVLARYKNSFPGTSCGKSCLRFKKMAHLDRDSLASMLHEVKEHRANNPDHHGC